MYAYACLRMSRASVDAYVLFVWVFVRVCVHEVYVYVTVCVLLCLCAHVCVGACLSVTVCVYQRIGFVCVSVCVRSLCAKKFRRAIPDVVFHAMMRASAQTTPCKLCVCLSAVNQEQGSTLPVELCVCRASFKSSVRITHLNCVFVELQSRRVSDAPKRLSDTILD